MRSPGGAFTCWIVLTVVCVMNGGRAEAQQALPPVIAPPDALFERFRPNDREAARAFCKKYIDVKGMAVVA